jgi:hypothetical protein
MLHKHRHHHINECASVDSMARTVQRATWTGCTGFKAGSLILLNDSTGPDGAQEYAVIRNGRQIESLTVSWMKLDELQTLLNHLDSGGGSEDMGPLAVKPHPDGYCQWCA